MSNPDLESPVNKLPVAVVILFLAMAGVEVVLGAGNSGLVGGPEAVGWRMRLVQSYGFSGQIFDQMLAIGRYPAEHLLRFFSYSFFHLSFSHALFALVLMLALGKLVGELMGNLAVIILFFGSAIGGALAYGLLLNDPVWLTGGYPAVYGLIGAYSYIMWRKLQVEGGPQMQAFTLIAILMGIQLIWSIFATVGNGWVAELAGFFTGFGLSFVVVPGGWSRLRHWLQQRR